MKNVIKKIKEQLKNHKYTNFYGDYLVRKVSVYVTWLFLHTNITANQISVLSAVIGALGALLLLARNPIYWLLGFLMFQVFILFDCVDGEMSRYRKTTSELGKKLEHIALSILNFLFFICAGLGMYFIFNNSLTVVLGLSAALCKITFPVVTPKGKISIIAYIPKQMGGFFQTIGVPALLDLFFKTAYFRLLYLIICGIGFPFVVIYRYKRK